MYFVALYKIRRLIRGQRQIRGEGNRLYASTVNLTWMTLHVILNLSLILSTTLTVISLQFFPFKGLVITAYINISIGTVIDISTCGLIIANMSSKDNQLQKSMAAEMLIKSGYLGPDYLSKNVTRVETRNREVDADEYRR